MISARLKHIFLALTLFAFLFLTLSNRSVQAQTEFSPFSNTNPDVKQDFHTAAQVFLIDTSSAFICQLIGIDVVHPQRPCLGIDRVTNKLGYVSNANEQGTQPKLGGAMGGMINLIVMTYNLPVHAGDYTSYLASNFGFVKSATAQGTGFHNLQSLMSLWTKVRDLTYLAFVLIFVIIGFAIMLRIKLDPRTVMSIQNQIPRVIIAILMITFSYAIAGVMIDFMWVVTYTGINIISDGIMCEDGVTLTQTATLNLIDTPIQYVGDLLNCHSGKGLLSYSHFAYTIGLTVGDILTRALMAVFGMNEIPPACELSVLDLGNSLSECLTRVRYDVTSWLIGIVAFLAILLAVFFQLFKIWFALLKSYIYIILYTISAPIWILLGLLPGNTTYGIGSWIRHLVFALGVYPLTAFMFMVAIVLMQDPTIQQPINNLGDAPTFIPPFIANPEIADNMGYILALAVILLTPEIVNMLREATKSPPSKYSPAIYAGLGAGAGVASQPISKAWGSLTKVDSTGNPQGPLAYAGAMASGKIWKKIVGGLGTGKIGTSAKNWFNDSKHAERLGGFDESGKPINKNKNNGNNGDTTAAVPTGQTNPPTGPAGGTGAQQKIPEGQTQEGKESKPSGETKPSDEQMTRLVRDIRTGTEQGAKEGVKEGLEGQTSVIQPPSTVPTGTPAPKGTSENPTTSAGEESDTKTTS